MRQSDSILQLALKLWSPGAILSSWPEYGSSIYILKNGSVWQAYVAHGAFSLCIPGTALAVAQNSWQCLSMWPWLPRAYYEDQAVLKLSEITCLPSAGIKGHHTLYRMPNDIWDKAQLFIWNVLSSPRAIANVFVLMPISSSKDKFRE